MGRFHNTFIRDLRLPSAKPQGELMDWYDSSHAQRTAQALVMQEPILATQILQPSTHFVRLAGDDVCVLFASFRISFLSIDISCFSNEKNPLFVFTFDLRNTT